MGFWSVYFIAKLVLYATGHLNLHVFLNLALAALVSLPPANARQRLAKAMLAVPVGVMLLYYDSWLPPFRRLLVSLPALSEFSVPYLIELAVRFIDLKALLGVVLAIGAYLLLGRKLRLGTFAVLGLIIAAALPPPGTATAPHADPRGSATQATGAATPLATDAELDAALKNFRSAEAKRHIELPMMADGEPYDIVLIHVCSLAWDDLRFVGMQDDAFLKRFDVLFTHFNSAASYSGPAAIRLLRANCGQATHRDLYTPAAPDCYLLSGLEHAGFEPHWLMNHDGHFGDFFADVRLRGGVDVAPESNAGAAVIQNAFDGTPVYGDYSVLSKWWAARIKNPVQRQVLYYNTISLHDGNHVKGAPISSAKESFANRTRTLFSDIGRFMDLVAASHRHVVLVFIPEHGAGLQGERRQIQGLREVPSAAITQVPVGVALIGGEARDGKAQQSVDAPVSYLALAELLARMVASDPFAAAAEMSVRPWMQKLPETLPVAENENTVIIEAGGAQQMRTTDGHWEPWDPGR
ncbi:MAG: cellulose biosynthesis protein BcsG [Steroidobacterales bacterium]